MTDPRFAAEHSGLFHLPAERRPSVAAASQTAGLKARTADLAGCMALPQALATLGSALELPDWFGANLDALHDCLTDPDLLPERGVALFLDGLESLSRSDEEGCGWLLEALQSAADTNAQEGLPCFIFLDTRLRGMRTFPDA